MDKKELLKRLEAYYSLPEVEDGFPTQQACISWSNKVGELLKRAGTGYYQNFMSQAVKMNLNLSSYTLVPAFNIMKSQLEQAIENLKLQVETPSPLEEIYFSENSHLEIQKAVGSVIQESRNSLWIFDPYMDEKIVEELTNVNAQEIQLLTTKPKGLFIQRLNAAKAQYTQKSINAKVAHRSHDRFFIIDELKVWSLGASLNRAGGKATCLHFIKDEKQKMRIIDDFKSWWKQGDAV